MPGQPRRIQSPIIPFITGNYYCCNDPIATQRPSQPYCRSTTLSIPFPSTLIHPTSILPSSQAMARTGVKAKHSTGGNAPHRPLGQAQDPARAQTGARIGSTDSSVELESPESQRPERRSVTAGASESQDSEVSARANESL